MSATTSGIVLIAIGAVAMLGAVFNWWIVTRPTRLFNMLFGETVARVIYFVLGSLLFIRGVGQLIGKNWI
jgi:hypothetical protein